MPLLIAAILALASASPVAGRDSVRDRALKDGAVEEIVVSDGVPLELSELAATADVIAEVVVVSARSFLANDEQEIWTDYRVEVLNMLSPERRGNLGPALVVRRRGGSVKVDGRTFSSSESGFAAFERGGQYVLFLRNAERGVYHVAGGTYGAFPLANGAVTRVVGLSDFRASVSRHLQSASATPSVTGTR